MIRYDDIRSQFYRDTMEAYETRNAPPNVQSNFFREKLETFLHQRQKAVQPLLHHLRP